MAGNDGQAETAAVDESQQLQSRVDKLWRAIDNEADSNLADRDDLAEICKVLRRISARITRKDGAAAPEQEQEQEQELLPQSKREELDKLLPAIERAFQRRKSSSPLKAEQQDDGHPAAGKKPSCNPFKPRPSPPSSKQQHKEEDDGGVSVKLLLRLAQNVLEPEQYYEWTTSYVDESRIYGWDKDADEVADALVAPDKPKEEEDDGESSRPLLFRAAAIAGVHGSGKTALAQKVFVHDKAKDSFALRLWVCVGPPDSEDRFCLLYRMLDNLGLDTAKLEDIVDKSNAVKPHREAAEARIRADPAAIADIRNKAKAENTERLLKEKADKSPQVESVLIHAVPDDPDALDDPYPEIRAVRADPEISFQIDADPDIPDALADMHNKAKAARTKEEESEERIFERLLKEEADKSPEVEKSKIGVLLYILHMTLSKTSYMIVFDDIREYGDDGWYSNLAQRPPPDGEWGGRLGYGLPKGNLHRGAVLLTCRNEEHARSMVRTGRVFRPPKLEGDDAWKLFEREYQQQKEAKRNKQKEDDAAAAKVDDDMLLKELREMKEQIVAKCLGLPVAIAQAARGFAALDPLPDPDDANKAAATHAPAAETAADKSATS